MTPVSKTILNALSSHSGVALPEIGTLSVLRKPATLKGRRKLTPPRNVVVFSPGQRPGAISVLQLIDRGVNDMHKTEEAYSEWLGEARNGPSSVMIHGVGEIRDGDFTVDPQLDAMLNPESGDTIMLSPRVKSLHMVFMALGAVVLVGAVYYLFFYRTPEQQRYDEMMRMSRNLENHNKGLAERGVDVISSDPQLQPPSDNEPAPAADSTKTAKPAKEAKPDVTKPGTTPAAGTDNAAQPEANPAANPATKPAAQNVAAQQTAAKPAVQNPTQATTGQTTTKPASQNTTQPATATPAARPASQNTAKATPQPAAHAAKPEPAKTAATGPLYHLVMGVFSTQENADKFIREFSTKDASVKCTVVPMSNGKFVVSGYGASDKADVETRRKQMADKYPDAWIYKQNR